MEAEKITVACLPGQDESDDENTLLDNDVVDDDDREMLREVLGRD